MVTSSTRISGGNDEVIFSRNVDSCAFVASPGQALAGSVTDRIATVALRAGTTNGVFILTQSASTATVADAPFHLIVMCR